MSWDIKTTLRGWVTDIAQMLIGRTVGRQQSDTATACSTTSEERKDMGDLTKNFSLREFTKSQTAKRLEIHNYPGHKELLNIRRTATLLQNIRDYIGLPVIVTSGYRCSELCLAIGSKSTSQHAKGEAADIEALGMSNLELAKIIRDNFIFDQLILEFYDPSDPEGGWVHVSVVEEGNRGEVITYDGERYKWGLPT